MCYVVADKNADKSKIENEIKNMPNYFAEYDTYVNFISKEEMIKEHSKLPHGGKVIIKSQTGIKNENSHMIEFSLKLDSNPEFTATCLVAFAKAIYKKYKKNEFGCKTVFDISLSEITNMSNDELLTTIL